MSTGPHYVILGGGLAGYSAAKTLRLAGFEGRVTLIGEEPVPPYERPPLSKSFLQGKKTAQELAFQSIEEYERLGIELVLGQRATGIDVAARRVTLGGGETLAFDKLLIATGASPIRLSQPGFDLPGVCYLRTLADARAIAERLEGAGSVLVLGAGFIGSEVAASLRILGHEVTLVDLLPAPMARSLGEEIGQIYAEVHRRHGVELRMLTGVRELRGHRRVEEAVLDDGERVACDLVVIGVGVRPEIGLFKDTGIEIERGIVVDEHCQTNIPGIYAAGDVAQWWHPVIERRLLVEHYDNAALQGAAAAKAMLGQPEPYAPLPYFWSDQYDVNLQFVGYPGHWEQQVLRGDPHAQEPSLTIFYLRHDEVQGAITINRPRDLRPARRLCEARARIDPDILADVEVDLRALSRQIPAST